MKSWMSESRHTHTSSNFPSNFSAASTNWMIFSSNLFVRQIVISMLYGKNWTKFPVQFFSPAKNGRISHPIFGNEKLDGKIGRGFGLRFGIHSRPPAEVHKQLNVLKRTSWGPAWPYLSFGRQNGQRELLEAYSGDIRGQAAKMLKMGFLRPFWET